MAKITAALVTVTLEPEDIDRSPDGRIGIRTFPKVQFGNSALEYTALGIPMPALGKFGFEFAIKRVYIEQPADGFIYHFDRANHKLRIFEGSAIGAIAVTAASAGTPAGNLANLVAANHTHTLANITINPHSHGLEVAANGAGDPVDAAAALYANATGPKLAANRAANVLIPGGVAANGGVANATSTIATQGDAVGKIPANSTGNFVGDALSNHGHALTGAGGSAAAPLSEVDAAHAPAPTTLYMEMVGR